MSDKISGKQNHYNTDTPELSPPSHAPLPEITDTIHMPHATMVAEAMERYVAEGTLELSEVSFLNRLLTLVPMRKMDLIASDLIHYANMPVEYRAEAAWKQLFKTPRRGMVYFGLPEAMTDTVGQHTVNIISFIKHLQPALLAENYETPLDFALMEKMAYLHDLPESLFGDPIPMDRLTSREKGVLESIGANIILGRYARDRQIYGIYTAKNSREALLVSDIDKGVEHDFEILCHILKLSSVTAEGGIQMQAGYNGFLSWVMQVSKRAESRLKTPFGKSIHGHMLEIIKSYVRDGQFNAFEACDSAEIAISKLCCRLH